MRSAQSRRCLATLCVAVLGVVVPTAMACSKVSINADQVLVIDGAKVFPIGFTMPPPPEGRTTAGRDAFEELAAAGATFLRTGVMGGPWNDTAIEHEQRWLDAAARHGLHCWVFLRELGAIGPETPQRELMLRKVVTRFRDHPGLGVWKGVDEPEWGKHAIPPLVRAREILRELDPDHPVAVTHAPRGTVESLRPYNAAADITGADIYPIGYPPGTHSLGTNKSISMVGDYTRTMAKVSEGKMPVWMILQIAWSGVIKPGKTLRFPTFPEERFMAYQAIINGARGLIFFGGHLALSPDDSKFGWNWTYWKRVLRPVVEELGSKSPLHAALTAPASRLPITVRAAQGEGGIEFCAREVNGELFILACKAQGETEPVSFSGLPEWAAHGEVMFESPRSVSASAGRFHDWFAPFEVHVYRFKNNAP